MKILSVKSHAKVNPYLEVVEREASGLHILRSILFKVELADIINFQITPSSSFEVNLTTRFSAELKSHLDICRSLYSSEVDAISVAIHGPDNLARKSADIVLRICDPLLRSCYGLRIEIELLKKIPFGAGLGGGSSNAAIVAKTLSELLLNQFGKNLSLEERFIVKKNVQTEVSALGSDIASFFTEGPVMILETGRISLPLFCKQAAILDFWKSVDVAIVKPPCFVSTADAYSWLAYDRQVDNSYCKCRIHTGYPIECSIDHTEAQKIATFFGLSLADFAKQAASYEAQDSGEKVGKEPGKQYLDLFFNDFEQVVNKRYHSISNLKSLLESLGAVAILSGSGSSVIGAFLNGSLTLSAMR